MMSKRRLSRILFLDFDGVLHAVNGPAFIRLPILEAWLRQRADVGIVISSSWREHMPTEKLAELFSSDLRARVIGVTPMWPTGGWDRPAGPIRHAEVIAWLDENRGIQEWAILDDQALLFPKGLERLVITDGRVGVTADDLQRLEAILTLRRKLS